MTTHTIALARHTAQVVGLMGVLVLGTIYGVVIGVLLSFVDVIRRASQPSRELLGVISGQPGFYPLGRMSQAHPLEGVALYRFSGGLFFANIDRFQKDVENCVKPGIRAVIVDASGIVSVDLTSAERLVLLYRRLLRNKQPTAIPFLPFLACGCSVATLAELFL